MSAGSSNSSTDQIQLLRYLQENLKMASKLTLSETPENVAIFIGTTKSGKSTLLNSLLGNTLISQKVPKLRSINIVKADNSLGPEIGRGPTSETIYPSRWISSKKLNGLVMWDSGGFEDNRGPIQDITNAYYTYRLFNSVNSAKIILVTDVNDILTDRINPFLSLLASVENIFKDELNKCFSNIIVVFTKVPNDLDEEPVNVEFISGVLEHQILSTVSIDMSESTKNFIKHLTLNHKQIALFKKASVGQIPSNVDAEIIETIQSINGVGREILMSVSPSIAVKSQLFLHNGRHELLSINSFTELENSINSAFEEKLKEYRRIIINEESRAILSLKKQELITFKDLIQSIIDANMSFHGKIEALKKIDPKFKNQIEAGNLIEKSNMMEFIDSVLGLKESHIFNSSFESIIGTTKSEINEIIIDLQVKLHEVDKKDAEEYIKKIREKEKEERERNEEERRNLAKENEETINRFFAGLGEKIGHGIDMGIDYCANNLIGRIKNLLK